MGEISSAVVMDVVKTSVNITAKRRIARIFTQERDEFCENIFPPVISFEMPRWIIRILGSDCKQGLLTESYTRVILLV